MDKLDVDEVIRVAVFRSRLRHFLRESERIASRHGLTPQRYLLLLMIKGASDGSQRTTVTELTKRLQLEQHTVTELVSRAAGAGLIRRQRSPSDGRVTHLSLSAKGEARLAASFRDLDVERLALAAAISKLGGRRPRSR